MSENPVPTNEVAEKPVPEDTGKKCPLPKNNGSGYTDEAVESRLLAGGTLEGQERDAAYAAWMRAYSERRSKMAGAISILAAALALTGGFASNSTAVPVGIVGAVIVLIALIGGIFATHQVLGRDREAIEAAAAVHQLRSEKS